MPDALAVRRENARMAWGNVATGGAIESGTDPVDVLAEALDAAIEAATQVRITREVTAAAHSGFTGQDVHAAIDAAVTAAFKAAGFEVTDATA